MATQILGIDVGSYSVKVAVLEASFRNLRLVGLHERTIKPRVSTEDTTEIQPNLAPGMQTLKELLEETKLRHETVVTALDRPGMCKRLLLPFMDAKKIEQALPFELENESLFKIQDHVVDFLLPGTSSTNSQATVLAATLSKQALQDHLSQMAHLHLQPRVVTAAATSTSALSSISGGLPTERPLVLLNIGHESTHFTLLQHDTKPLFARTLGRGSKDITKALMQALQVQEAQAETIKHASSLFPLPTAEEDSKHLARLMQEALHPWMRDLKQTWAALFEFLSSAPHSIVLCGGGAKLQGLDVFLSQQLGVPVALWQPLAPWLSGWGGYENATPVQFASSLGLALIPAKSLSFLNFRKDEFAYRTHRQIFRTHVRGLIAAGATMLAFAGLALFAANYADQKEQAALESQVRTKTKAVFGKEMVKLSEIQAELDQVINTKKTRVLPTMSVLDILEALSTNVPKEAKLDVFELKIEKQKILGRLTLVSTQQENLQTLWKKIPCFHNNVAFKDGVEVKTQSSDNIKSFNLEITHDCL